MWRSPLVNEERFLKVYSYLCELDDLYSMSFHKFVMKKLFVGILMVFSVGFVSAQPVTDIQVQDQSPSIAEPGDTVRLSVVVANNGDSEASYQSLDVETVDGVSYRGTTSNYNDGFSLCGGCQTIGTIYLKVSKDASSGSYPVDLNLENADSTGVVEKTVLEVDGSPELVLKGNGSVMQGESSEIDLELENTGKDSASQVTASLTHPLISFQPSKIDFGSIKTGESIENTLEINTDENLESGPETVPVTLSYTDGDRFVENTSVPIDVLKDVNLVVSQVDSDAIIGSESRVMIELENTGESKAEGIKSKVECEDSSVTDSESFVGSLDSDESVPTVYHVVPEKEIAECTLTASYTGENEKTLEESFEISAEKKSPVLPGLTVLMVLIVSLLYWRRRSKED